MQDQNQSWRFLDWLIKKREEDTVEVKSSSWKELYIVAAIFYWGQEIWISPWWK